MALCSYSSKLMIDNYTVLDNAFLNEFLPQASGDDVKVYLYGLNLCSNPNVEDNNLDTICKTLSLSEDEIVKSFSYWQEMGLVQIVSTNPLEIRYLPIRAHSGSSKLRDKSKYKDFNKQMQQVITGRMITPNEFNEYYTLIEVYHFEPEAIVLIAKYCTTIKSPSINYPYILAVAKDFASQGLKTVVTVEERFLEQEKSTAEIKQVLSALGLKRDADIEERNLYLKWTNGLGFIQGVIVEVAKSLKKKGGFVKLDEMLTKFYEQHLFTISEINEFSEKREAMFDIAKTISKNLGLTYQTYENVVDTYISDWTNKGYEMDALVFISQYCFKQSLRTLEGMNTVVQKFFKLGLVSLASINQYISGIIENDEKIKEVIDKSGLLRSVSSFDREVYKTWTGDWGFTHEQILMVAEVSKGMGNPITYLNKVLSNFHEQGQTSTEQIKKQIESIKKGMCKTSSKQTEQGFASRTYTPEQLAAVYDSLDDVIM